MEATIQNPLAKIQITTRKSFHGWTSETTVRNLHGFDWKITTLKNYKGNILTTAQGGTIEEKEGYNTFSFMMFQDPVKYLIERKGRATAKAIEGQHLEALEEFKRLAENNELI